TIGDDAPSDRYQRECSRGTPPDAERDESEDGVWVRRSGVAILPSQVALDETSSEDYADDEEEASEEQAHHPYSGRRVQPRQCFEHGAGGTIPPWAQSDSARGRLDEGLAAGEHGRTYGA